MHRNQGCFVLAAWMCGCGAAAQPVVVKNDIEITIVAAVTDLPFDPRSARIAQATRQLTVALVRRVDAFLDEPHVQSGEGGEPAKTMRAILRRMCDEGGAADVARLHGALMQRAARGKDDGSALQVLVADSAPGRCGPR